jgi:hypothetical protein
VGGLRRGVGLGALAGLLELLLQDLARVLRVLDRAGELFVEDSLLRLHAVDEVVEVLGRCLLLVGPHHRARLRVHLQERLAARAGHVERFGHGSF